MRKFLLLLCLAGAASADTALFHQSRFTAGEDGAPSGWVSWAPRDEIAPRTFVDGLHSRGEEGALVVSGASNPAAFGGWRHTVEGIVPGAWYRLKAYYLPQGVRHESLAVLARIEWRRADGKRTGYPEYAYHIEREGAWRKVTLAAPAPKDAVAAMIQLYLTNAPQATLWWDEISLERVEAPGPRMVKVVAVKLRPRETGSREASVARFLDIIEKQVPADADVILLPEGITVIGSHKTYVEVAEPVPGPTTALLGKAARAKNAYLVAGLYEREGQAVYNTAVLLDREGRLAGKYRKVYIPREESDGGLTPGSDYPVFRTDFGTIGMMICWDVQYPDPARALALKGAELLLMPIAGGDEILVKARAIENHVFLAASGYDIPTHVIDPRGEMLAVASEDGSVAVATIDLNKRFTERWIGEVRGRYFNEIRTDVPTFPAH